MAGKLEIHAARKSYRHVKNIRDTREPAPRLLQLRDVGPYSTRNIAKGASLTDAAPVFAALRSGLTVEQVRDRALSGDVLSQRGWSSRKRVWAALCQVSTVVITPLRQQISQKQNRQKEVKAELKASTDGETSVQAIGELKGELDRLKIEIRDLRSRVGDIQDCCDGLRALISEWDCPGVEDWESWLAEQPLYDAISSVDGRRRLPTTVDDWIAQEQTYFPDINDGVRVNIAPLQKAGLLAADVLAKKDLDKAIADRSEWRRDERRWVREGRLPRPGWWAEGEDEG